jgi:hypothetical protein
MSMVRCVRTPEPSGFAGDDQETGVGVCQRPVQRLADIARILDLFGARAETRCDMFDVHVRIGEVHADEARRFQRRSHRMAPEVIEQLIFLVHETDDSTGCSGLRGARECLALADARSTYGERVSRGDETKYTFPATRARLRYSFRSTSDRVMPTLPGNARRRRFKLQKHRLCGSSHTKDREYLRCCIRCQPSKTQYSLGESECTKACWERQLEIWRMQWKLQQAAQVVDVRREPQPRNTRAGSACCRSWSK